MKMPWQMRRDEWDAAGQPTLGYEKRKKKPPWKTTADAEVEAINDFKSVAGSGRGGRIAPYDYDPIDYNYLRRDESFAKGEHRFMSKLDFTPELKKAGVYGGQEDAREAIIFGRKMGFNDKDIMYYLKRGYDINGRKLK